MIPVARPWLGPQEASAVARVLRSGWVTQGPEVEAFEREFASAVGARHACAVSSGTAALQVALETVGVGPGTEVVTASQSFIATANSILACGAVPVFVDVEPEGLNLDPALVDRLITPRTRAILCVHQLGMPCDLWRLAGLARRRGVALIEDAACALGSEVRWRGRWERVGRPHGDIACFSFHPRKLVTTGDGGMLTTARRDWDRRFRLLRHHGMSVSDASRHRALGLVLEEFVVPGYNFRLTDIQAAVGRIQLQRLPRLLASRRRLAEVYGRSLGGIDGLGLPRESEGTRSNWQSYCILMPPGIDRDRFLRRALEAGLSMRRGVMCAHREPAYRDVPWKSGSLSRSERSQDRGVILPLYYGLTRKDQNRVIHFVRKECGA